MGLIKLKAAVYNFIHSPFHKNWHVFAVLIPFSYTLLAIDSGWGYLGSFMAPNFVAAFLFTLSLALMLAIYLHHIYHSWMGNFRLSLRSARFWRQLALGILLPITVDLFAVELFFVARGESIWSNTFFDVDFTLIVFYILLLNAFYSYANYTFGRNLRLRAVLKRRVIPAFKDLASLKKLHRYELMKQAPVSLIDFKLEDLQIAMNQIACVYKIGALTVIHYFNQQTVSVPLSLNNIFNLQDPREYIKINPYCFYHRMVIFSHTEMPRSRRIYLRLRHPFNHLVHDKQRIVSQSVAIDFKKWLNAPVILS